MNIGTMKCREDVENSGTGGDERLGKRSQCRYCGRGGEVLNLVGTLVGEERCFTL